MGKRTSALFEGFFTCLDPIGTVLGYVTGKDNYIGYCADRFGNDSPMEPPYPIMKPKEWSLEEQVFKGLGDSAGIMFNMYTIGVPALFCHLANMFSNHEKKNLSKEERPHLEILFDGVVEHIY